MAILGETKRRILSEVRRRKLHGYALAHALRIPVTGVYQHLADLETEGLVSASKVGRRKVYGLTAKGQRLLDLIKD